MFLHRIAAAVSMSRRQFSLAALAAGWGLASHAETVDKADVGIAMPTLVSQRWVVDGLAMTRYLDKLNYRADLRYANDDVALQITQIEDMLKRHVKVLIIGAIDGSKLAPALKVAAERGVKVIAYDRLIRDSSHVDYYATFDNFQVGVLQGQSIVDQLGLAQGKGPFNIELFGGSDDDNNAFFFYNGALSVLKPYVDKGSLVIGSGQIGMANVATRRWSGTIAHARLNDILTKHYAKRRLDAVLSPYDGITIELIAALRKNGYGSTQLPLPVITGQDAELASVRAIVRREQTSTVFKDTRELAQVTANMVDAIMNGKRPVTNDEKTYDNGQKVVPAYLLKPASVDINNWRQALIGTGYYKQEQFR